jgi:hypothetical protein
LITVVLAALLSGCVVLAPDGTVDVAKSRRQTENACGFLFLTGNAVVASTIGAWVCSFGVDATFPEPDEPAKKPTGKRKKQKPAPELDDEVD